MTKTVTQGQTQKPLNDASRKKGGAGSHPGEVACKASTQATAKRTQNEKNGKKTTAVVGSGSTSTPALATSEGLGGGSVQKVDAKLKSAATSATVVVVAIVGADDRCALLGGLLDSLLKVGVDPDSSSPGGLGSEEVDTLSGSPVRCSKRGANSANLDSINKAMKRTAHLNLDIDKGQSPTNSLPPRCSVKKFLPETAVCLGNSEVLVEESVARIESLEKIGRCLVCLNRLL